MARIRSVFALIHLALFTVLPASWRVKSVVAMRSAIGTHLLSDEWPLLNGLPGPLEHNDSAAGLLRSSAHFVDADAVELLFLLLTIDDDICRIIFFVHVQCRPHAARCSGVADDGVIGVLMGHSLDAQSSRLACG